MLRRWGLLSSVYFFFIFYLEGIGRATRPCPPRARLLDSLLRTTLPSPYLYFYVLCSITVSRLDIIINVRENPRKIPVWENFRNLYISVSPRHNSQLGFFYVNKYISIQNSQKRKRRGQMTNFTTCMHAALLPFSAPIPFFNAE